MEPLIEVGTFAAAGAALIIALWRGKKNGPTSSASGLHEHVFNKRIDDGVYRCACGDRYLDGKPKARK